MKRKKLEKKNKVRCINGVKGAISLFMAVLMTPFLTIAVLLVEIGRYNSAVSVMDEMLGVSSMSTLANYDDYLQKRWGLLAVSQDIDIDTVYRENLKTNSAAMGSAITIDSVTAEGEFALSDLEILEYQIMEYCKLNAPTKMGTEIASKLLDMLSFVKTIEDALSTPEKIASLLTKGVSSLDSGITMAKSAEELKKSADALDKLKTEYDTNYDTFKKAVNTLIDNLNEKKKQEDARKPLKEDLSKLKQELEALEKKKPSTDAAKKENAQAIKDKKQEIKDKEAEIKPYDTAISKLDSTIKSNRTAATKAQTAYATTIANIYKELTNFRDHMAKCQEAVSTIKQNVAGAVADGVAIATDLKKKRTDLEEKEKDLKALKKSVEEWDGALDDPAYIAGLEMKIALEEEVNQLQIEVGEMESVQSVADAASGGVGKMADEWSESFKTYNDATIGKVIEGFKGLERTVKALNITNVKHSTAKVTAKVYKAVAVNGYIAADKIQEYLDEQEKDLKTGSLKALLEGLMTMYKKLMDLDIFVDPELSSVIDVAYYEENFGGLPGGASAENPILEIMKDISSICKSGISLMNNLKDLKLLKMLEDLKAIAQSAKDLFEDMVNVVEDFLTNIAELVNYEKWYITTYCTYNLSCRTDFDDGSGNTSFSTMTGYGVGKESYCEPDPLTEVPMLGSLAAMVSTIVKAMSGKGQNLMFVGAELEYVMFGSTSEIANQLYVFVVIYLIRMLSSLPALLADAEVQSLAASATLGYPVVMALYILLEPLVQTILLINGNSQDVIPTEVYLSPSGLPKLVGELISFCSLTTKQSEELSNKMVDAVAKSKGDYDFQKKLYEYTNTSQKLQFSMKFDYKDYCWVVTLLTVTKERQLGRLSNLIQMETLCYYTNQKAEFTFDLKNSFTYLAVELDAKVNQILPSLADSSLFEIVRKHYRGY